jgi:hypothetical protein
MTIFLDSFYESNVAPGGGTAKIYPIRVANTVILAEGPGGVNEEPTSAVTEDVSAISCGSRRKAGVHARHLNLRRIVSTVDGTHYYARTKLTCLTEDFWASVKQGDEVTYNAFTWTCTGATPELIH